METRSLLDAPTEADRQQRVRPVLLGSEIDWLADDGQIVSIPASEVRVTWDDAARTTLAAAPGPAVVHVTDQRVVVVVPGAAVPLAVQVDHLCLALVRYTKPQAPGDLGLVEFGALTGSPAPRDVEIIAVSVAADDLEAVVQGVFARARSAQFRGDVRPLTPEALRCLEQAAFAQHGDVFRAVLTGSAVTLTDLADRTCSRI